MRTVTAYSYVQVQCPASRERRAGVPLGRECAMMCGSGGEWPAAPRRRPGFNHGVWFPPPSGAALLLPVSAAVTDHFRFRSLQVVFAVYHAYYFGRHRVKFLDSCGCVPALFGTVDLWTTAVESRVVWAQEMMRGASEALLAVQTLRNVVVAATLIVMAMAQVRWGVRISP